MKLVIIRHAEPNYEIDSLTEKGWREAELLSEKISKMDVKAFYCSPLGRAKDTAKATLKKMGRECEICNWLEEFPAYIINPETGEPKIPWDIYPDIWTNVPEMYDKDKWVKTELMQSGNVEEKYKEVCEKLDKLLEKHGYKREGNYYRAINPNNDTIVFFCHFGIECVLLSHILGISPVALSHGFVALPSSVTTLATEERKEGIAYFRCNGFGDLSHLYKGDEPASFAARFCECYFNEDERH